MGSLGGGRLTIRGGRSFLKIHFFIESGLKMIQFKTKSRIFIQKNIYQIGQWVSLGGGRLTIAVRAAMRHSRTRAGRTKRIRGPVALWSGTTSRDATTSTWWSALHKVIGPRPGKNDIVATHPCHFGRFWPIGMLQLLPAGFIHPLAANNLSIESRRCDQIFCAYSDQSGWLMT